MAISRSRSVAVVALALLAGSATAQAAPADTPKPVWLLPHLVKPIVPGGPLLSYSVTPLAQIPGLYTTA